MPEYLSPGVYVEEVDSGSAPIQGVSTNVTGFIGQVTAEADGAALTMPPVPGQFDNGEPRRYELAPAGEAQLLTNWNEFKVKFGDGIQPANRTLAHAVYGFFINGGTRCWVTRVAEMALDPVRAALEGFEAIDEISLVAVPGALDANIQNDVVNHCAKLQDRFAILDGQRAAVYTPENIVGGIADSNYAAIYFPWIKVPRPGATRPDDLEIVPPSGHLAGIYARSDSRRGVHKAPANEPIRGARDVEFRLSKGHQDGLNPHGVNVIRKFNGNITVWGARTLDRQNAEWRYINVRRLFLFLRESIDESTQWTVFEPNTPELWAKIIRNITAFLMIQWRAGALFGVTPEQAFYVKCDAETNPQELIDLGQVVTEIGVAPVKPAEFVIFRIRQWAGPGS